MSQRGVQNVEENAPVRRTTRATSARAAASLAVLTHATDRIANEDTPSTSRAASRPPSAAALKASRKEEAERKTQQVFTELKALINDPNVSGPKIDTFLSNHLNTSNRKKMLDIELWKPVLQKWMTTNMWAPFYYIINKRYADADSSPWFVYIITFMAENGIYEMFDKTHKKIHPLWSQIKKDVAEEDYEWWNQTLIGVSSKQNNMSRNEIEFFKRLYENNWFVPFDVYLYVHSDLHPLASLRFLEKNREYALLDSDEFYKLTYRIDKPNLFNLVLNIVEYYVTTKGSPPIIFTQGDSNSYNNIIKESKLFTFLEYCIKSKSTELLKAFTKLVDFNKMENKNGLSIYILYYIMIRYHITGNRTAEGVHIYTKPQFDTIKFILKNYKIDANSLYVDIDMVNIIRRGVAVFSDSTAFKVLFQMKPALSKFPILSLAVLFKCPELIRVLITYAKASPNRCAFSVYDLTTDDETIKALNIKRTLKHVTHRYKEETAKPENPVGRSRRSETWARHLKEQEDLLKAKEQEDLRNSGGSKKKTKKSK